MQIFILGMHRSGTSLVASLLREMGASAGSASQDIGANEENPRGFHERRDVIDFDQAVLQAVGCDWHRVHAFDLGRLPEVTRERFARAAAEIVHELDDERPWFVKDPRLCLTLPVWAGVAEQPVVVLVHRNPLEVAESLRRRNDFPHGFGIALWERYNLEALRASAELPTVILSYNELLARPHRTAVRLHAHLVAAGVLGLDRLTPEVAQGLVDRRLYRNRRAEPDLEELLNVKQLRLYRSLKDRTATVAEVPTPSQGGRLSLEEYELEIAAAEGLGIPLLTDEMEDEAAASEGAFDPRPGMSSRYRRLEDRLRELIDLQERTRERRDRAEAAYARAKTRVGRLEAINESLRRRIDGPAPD